MTSLSRFAAAAAAIGCIAAPAAAQYYPQQTYPQTYPQPAYPGYAQPNYGYSQGYAQNPVGAIIDQLLGNRYNVSDRQAVAQCATAAIAQAAAQYGGNYGYNNGSGYRGPDRNYYNHGASDFRVTSITDVQRRSNGLRVSGLMRSGVGHGGQYGYQNHGYGDAEISFRCNVDYRGAVTNIRIGRGNNGYRRY